MKKERKVICPNCKKVVNAGTKECPHCGKEMKKSRMFLKLFIIVWIVGMICTLMNQPNMISKIKNELNISTEEAKAISIVLNDVGLDKLDKITHDEYLDGEEGNGSRCYRIETNFASNIIIYVNELNEVICVRWLGKDFYRDGNIIMNFNDYDSEQE